MDKEQIYIGMGGNIGDSVKILHAALKEIKKIPGIDQLRCSQFYRTSPVSAIPQVYYINAVCAFQTSLSPMILVKHLQEIEKKLGKVPKIKDAPRVIDLDLLFHGNQVIDEVKLTVPHPKWKERLFVLIPLSELVDELVDPKEGTQIDLKEMLEKFNNTHQETLTAVEKPEVEE